jgi:hypothetical protein
MTYPVYILSKKVFISNVHIRNSLKKIFFNFKIDYLCNPLNVKLNVNSYLSFAHLWTSHK